VNVGRPWTPEIRLTNPSDGLMRVREAYTGDPFLKLDFPDHTHLPAGGGVWEILPRKTKEILRISFLADQPGLVNFNSMEFFFVVVSFFFIEPVQTRLPLTNLLT
jgi:hypothetical protein